MPGYLAASLRGALRRRFPAAYPLLIQSIYSPASALDGLREENFHNRRILRQGTLECNCCGKQGKPIYLFLPIVQFDRMGVSPLRDNIICAHCRSSQRTRSLLQAVRTVATESTGMDSVILDLDDSWSAGSVIAQLGQRQATTYDVGRPWGSIDEVGVRNEDIAGLTFEDGIFDIVVSAEVHEHVEDTWKAFAEVHRVLKPGGTYVFTVPCRSSFATTQRLAFGTEFGPLWTGFRHIHGDPRESGGIAAYWLFGMDLVERLREIGLEAVVSQVMPPGSPRVPVDVFIASKQPE